MQNSNLVLLVEDDFVNVVPIEKAPGTAVHQLELTMVPRILTREISRIVGGAVNLAFRTRNTLF